MQTAAVGLRQPDSLPCVAADVTGQGRPPSHALAGLSDGAHASTCGPDEAHVRKLRELQALDRSALPRRRGPCRELRKGRCGGVVGALLALALAIVPWVRRVRRAAVGGRSRRRVLGGDWFCGGLIKIEFYLAPAGALHGMGEQRESAAMVRRKRRR